MSRFGLAQGLADRSPRERALIAVLMLVALPLALYFLVAQPMLDARAAAQQDARDARVLRDWVADQVRLMPEDSGPGREDVEPTATVMGLAGLEQSLLAAGLRDHASQIADRSDGGIDLGFDEVSFVALNQWLTDVRPVWGYRIKSFRFDAAVPGLVNARFELELP